MKRTMAISILLLLALQLGVALADHETHEGFCEHFDTGQEFGQHVADHALGRHFSGEMNPGVHHQGYSPCVP